MVAEIHVPRRVGNKAVAMGHRQGFLQDPKHCHDYRSPRSLTCAGAALTEWGRGLGDVCSEAIWGFFGTFSCADNKMNFPMEGVGDGSHHGVRSPEV
jgi:hypothetical protein